MNKSEDLYIIHIIDAINAIEEFVKGYDLPKFANDRMRYDATIRNLQTIAEATQKLNTNTKNCYPDVPWRDISGFRNILVHDYLEGLDSEIIWSVIVKELPNLKSCMMLEMTKIRNKNNVWESYEKIVDWYDKNRNRNLFEQPYLDLVINYLKPISGNKILDLGCGMGQPIAQYFIERGFDVTGVDASQKMIDLARSRFPKNRFITSDMRKFSLNEKFDLVIAWDSFFHLLQDDQRKMFTTFALALNKDGILLFTSGPEESELWSNNGGEDLYHASLSIDEYKKLLNNSGFELITCKIEDKNCNDHTIWVAKYLGSAK